MTFPAAGTPVASASTTWRTSHPFDVPAHNAGDLQVLSVGLNGLSSTITGPSGWTEALSVDLNANQVWRVYLRKASTSSSATTATVTSSSTMRGGGVCVNVVGWEGTITEDTGWSISAGTGSGYGTTVNPDEVTAAWGADDNLAVAMMMAAGNSPSVSSYPSGYSSGTDATDLAMVALAVKTTTSASDDPSTFTISNSNNHRAATLMIRPTGDIALGIATETDTALGVTAFNSITILGIATETDTALAPIVDRTISVGIASETDTGLPVAVQVGPVPSDLTVEWDFDNDGDYSETVEDITSYVIAGTVRRGRDFASQLTGRSTPGQMRLVLDNSDDRFSHYNTSSPLMAGNLSLKSGRRIRIRDSGATPLLPTLLLRDRFGTAGLVGTAETGQTWTTQTTAGLSALSGVATADGPSTGAGTDHAVTVDIGAATCHFQVLITQRDGTNQAGVVYRWTDDDNFGIVYAGDGFVQVREKIGGSWTTITSSGIENRDNYTMGIALNDDQILVYIDGVEEIDTTHNLATSTEVGLWVNWNGQRAPGFSEAYAWDRSWITQDWETAEDYRGTLATMTVTGVMPEIDREHRKIAVVTAVGDMGQLDRDIFPPASTGPDTVQSAGVKAGHMIGNILHRLTAAHPPATIEGGDIALGSVGFDRQRAISLVRRFEETEAGFVYEPRTGGVAFDRRSARDADGSSVATFSDAPGFEQFRIETARLRNSQGDIINEVTSQVAPILPRQTVFTDSGNTALGVENSIELTMPNEAPHADDAEVGDLVIVAIVSTVQTDGTSWLSPIGWENLRPLQDELGLQRVYARRLRAGDFNTSVKFYDDATDTAGGAWHAIILLVKNWYGVIDSGVAMTEHSGFGSPHSTALARAGDNDPPTMLTPWGTGPTLFFPIRAGMVASTGGGATVSSAADNLAPNGYDSLGSSFINANAGGSYDVAQQWARRIRSEKVNDPSPFGGQFENFDYTEAVTIAIRGFAGDPPPSSGGFDVTSRNDQSILDHGSVRAHPFPGILFETEAAALTYNDLMLTRFDQDRPIVTIGFHANASTRLRQTVINDLDLSSRITITADGPIGFGFDQQFFIEAERWTFDNGIRRWYVEYDCSPEADAGGGAD